VTVTGYGVVCRERDVSVRALGEIKPRSTDALSEKLAHIYREIEGIIAETGPDAVAVEGLFHAKNVKSAISLGHARGVLLLASARSNIPVYEYAPREVKAAATGYGGAGKDQVGAMVRRLLCLDGDIGDHACDALAVAMCHMHSMGPLGMKKTV
jgi:crossover junction endodeoxyribonuclease RuvC